MTATVDTSAPAPEPFINVSNVLDTARFGAAQLTVLAFTFFTLVMDGFDIQAIAFTAPALTEAWGIERSSLGPVLAAALLGMALGAAGIGSYGDRSGRKTALIASCVMMALGSTASALATGPIELAIYRFVTGVGLGGAMPNATAMMFEFAPKKWRQFTVAFALVGVPLGGMLGAAMARWLIPAYGWQALFLVGGLIPALLAVAMWLGLPESPRFLSTKPQRTGELARLLNRIAGNQRFTATLAYAAESVASAGKSTVGALFTPEFRRDTLTLWLIFFTNVFSVYFFWNWLPTVLASANLSFQISVTGSLYFNLGGVPGALVGSLLTGRYGSRKVLVFAGVATLLSVVSIGMNGVFSGTGGSITALMWSMASAGCFINMLQIGMFAVAANAYPTYCRSTGVGWGLGIARFGGIFSAFAGAGFFALGFAPRDFFFVIAGVLAITLVGVITLRRHIPPTLQGSSHEVPH